MSATPLPTCDLDAFCCAPPGHDGPCDQPFETEYRVGACSPVVWLVMTREIEEKLMRDEKRILGVDWAAPSQADLFG